MKKLFCAEFDNFSVKKCRVEIHETDDGAKLVLCNADYHDVVLFDATRDQWGTWIAVGDMTTVAQEDGTRSFIGSLIAALEKFKELTDVETQSPTITQP